MNVKKIKDHKQQHTIGKFPFQKKNTKLHHINNSQQIADLSIHLPHS